MKKRLINFIFVFFVIVISASQAFSHVEDCYVWEIEATGFSEIIILENPGIMVSGYAETFVEGNVNSPPWYCYDYELGSFVSSNLTGPGVASHEEEYSFNPNAEADHATFEAEPGETYCVSSAHGGQIGFTWNDHSGNDQEVTTLTGKSFSDACHTFEEEPTPTPTPTPTPPCFTCQDITATIGAIEIIEKYAVVNVPITVSNATDAEGTPLTTTFSVSLKANSGTGNATFEDGSTSISFQGDVMNQNLRIKGVTESKQLDNIIIEAKYTNRVLASDTFTVAFIESLEFENINTDDDAIDANPGNGQTGTNIGRRIFPDRISPTNTTDRSIIRVRAKVLPEVPGINVYFASYDLDDPSADGSPIDPTDTTANPRDGNDNNGGMTTPTVLPKSGELRKEHPTSRSCSNQGISNDISFIQCETAPLLEGAKANFKVTMQPGDNFAVFATVDNEYLRDSQNQFKIRVNPQAGTNLINSANQTIHISGQTNPNNVQGIRTDMLTVWRKLHLERDEMANVPVSTDMNANNVRGTISTTGRITAGTGVFDLPIDNNPALMNEPFRFYNGRIQFGTNSLVVVQTSPTLIRVRRTNQNIRFNAGDQFFLYDDDDYNDNDTLLDGDNGEAIDPITNIYGNTYATPFLTAYISIETTQVQHFDDSNVPFTLNIDTVSPTAGTTINNLVNLNRGSAANENDSFWIAYILLSYQGALIEDYDGFTCPGGGPNCQTEAPLFGAVASPTQNCDCLCDSSSPANCNLSCPTGGIVCSVVPQGGNGGIILQEVIRDHNLFWRTPPNNKIITLDRTIIAHEIAHQFGIKGDNLNSTEFRIMDYPDYNLPNTTGPLPEFHPQHINIMRKRVHSPGQN